MITTENFSFQPKSESENDTAADALRSAIQTEIFGCRAQERQQNDYQVSAQTGDKTSQKPTDRPPNGTVATTSERQSVKANDKPKTTSGETPLDRPPTPDYKSLVTQLNDDNYFKREAATRQLKAADHNAVPLVFAAANGGNPEVARRSRDILQHMLRRFTVDELVKSPDLLHCIPHYSLTDRRQSAQQLIDEHPGDKSYKAYLGSLANEAEFLRLNPKFVKDKIAAAEKIAADPGIRDYVREGEKQWAELLKKIDVLAIELKIDKVLYSNDPKEQLKLASQALSLNPTLVFDWKQRDKLQKSGVLEDPEFADKWVLSGGDPKAVGGKHQDWAKIEKTLQNRIDEQRRLNGGKDNGHVADAIHLLAAANERQGHADKAISLYAEEIRVQQKVNPSDRSIRSNMVSLGNLQLKQGKLDDGIKTYESVDKLDSANKEKQNSNSNSVLDKLIELYEQKDNSRKVIELEERAIKEGNWQWEKDKLCSRYHHIAAKLEKLGDLDGAEKRLKEAVKAKTAEAKDGKDLPWSATDFMALANFYVRHNRAADAAPFFRRAIAVTEHDRFSRITLPAMKGLLAYLESAPTKENADERKSLTASIRARE